MTREYLTYKTYVVLLLLFLTSLFVKSQKYAINYDFKSNVYHLQNIDNGIVDTVKYDMIEWRDGFYILKKNSKYGLLDNNGELVFPLNSESISVSDDYIYNKCIVNSLYLKYFLYSKNIEPVDTSDRVPVFFIPFFIISKNKRIGVIDTLGNLVLPFEFDEVTIFINSSLEYRFLCQKNSMSGLLDINGKEIIPFSNHQLGILNRNLDEVFTEKEYYRSKYISFYKSGKFGRFDDNGEIVIPADYDNGYDFFSNGLFCLARDKKFGFVDTNNKVVIPFIYDEVVPFKNSVASVKLDSKYSFIDDKNNEIVLFDHYTTHFNFINGISIFSKVGSKFGMIDTVGEVIVTNKYDRLVFVNWGQYYRAYLDKKVGVIDYYGKEIIPPTYDFVTEFKGFGMRSFYSPDMLFLIKKDKKFGVVNSKNEIVLDIIYDDLLIEDGIVIFKKDSYYGLMDFDCKIILESEFLNVKVHNSEWISVLDKEGNNYTVDKFGKRI